MIEIVPYVFSGVFYVKKNVFIERYIKEAVPVDNLNARLVIEIKVERLVLLFFFVEDVRKRFK